MSSTTFTNELGNTITVEVDAATVSGVQGVRISIVGPGSQTESFITMQEAQVLHQELGRVLADPGQ